MACAWEGDLGLGAIVLAQVRSGLRAGASKRTKHRGAPAKSSSADRRGPRRRCPGSKPRSPSPGWYRSRCPSTTVKRSIGDVGAVGTGIARVCVCVLSGASPSQVSASRTSNNSKSDMMLSSAEANEAASFGIGTPSCAPRTSRGRSNQCSSRTWRSVQEDRWS